MNTPVRSSIGTPLLLFATTLFTGAFLLFQIQPLIAKYILPWFGGSPSVWTTCVLLFQLLLFAGYGYAHLALKHFSPRAQTTLHIVLLMVGIATLPVVPSAHWKLESAGDPTWRILVLLALSTGLPYLLVASTGPLLQAWLTHLSPRASPYRLFALSNLASLSALISYPVLIEPFFSRYTQAIVWSVGYSIFAIFCAGCALVYRKACVPIRPVDSQSSHGSATTFTRLLWILLPACGTLILLATTNKICQEVAVIPFLWILPLALYLLTFVIAFDSPLWYRRGFFFWLLPVAIAGVALMLLLGQGASISLQLATYCGTLFICCLICHGELARLKPQPAQLTGYYLNLCAGGALGGLFVAVIAPLIFTSYFEFPLGLLLTVVLAAAILVSDKTSRLYNGKSGGAWVTLIILYMLLGYLLVAAHVGTADKIVAASRSFYGALAVVSRDEDKPQLHYNLFRHGSITHGIQFTDKELRDKPTTYFGPTSGVGLAFEHFATSPRKVGIVGLGAGTLAAYGRAGDRFRFYEINPHVLDFAQTYFTFLKDSPAQLEHVLGDARLSLEREADQHFDLLVLDAFNGDAIPMHLLTKEAFELYRRHLKADGVVAVHITNHYLDLRPVIQGAGEYLGLKWRFVLDEHDENSSVYTSEWMLLCGDEKWLGSLVAGKLVGPSKSGARLWTDDRTGLFPVLR